MVGPYEQKRALLIPFKPKLKGMLRRSFLPVTRLGLCSRGGPENSLVGCVEWRNGKEVDTLLTHLAVTCVPEGNRGFTMLTAVLWQWCSSEQVDQLPVDHCVGGAVVLIGRTDQSVINC